MYITEAHPTDGWSVKSSSQPDVTQQRTFEERLNTARMFMKNISATNNAKVLVDYMDNRANITFGAIPERLVVLRDGKISFLGGPGPFKYSVKDLDRYLSTLL